jgi:hypothetical protein
MVHSASQEIFIGWARPAIFIGLASNNGDGGRCRPYEDFAFFNRVDDSFGLEDPNYLARPDSGSMGPPDGTTSR